MRVIEKHPLWLRWVHWLNAPVLAGMVWSGILIYWANDVYRPFFPERFYSALSLDHRLPEGMAVHFTLAWVFVLNGVAYLAFLFSRGHFKELFPDRRAWKD